MKKTYSATLVEITRLQQQAEQLRKLEAKGVIGRIREAIHVYGLTAEDLGFTSESKARSAPAHNGAKAKLGPKAKPSKPSKAATVIGVAKYRDPKSGKTWTGRGKPPNWIAGAKTRDAFAIDAPVSANETANAAKPATA